MVQWHTDSDRMEKGDMLWAHYQRLTSGLSQRLCEQLRLLLEPTQKAKMEGDYRTGKRINMRKVISYIASQYRKDKIWMRRTKANKRQYQIMVAIDDTRSMMDNRGGTLALQAMAVICQALQQLEVGQVAVAKFGETTELLHEFGQPFSNSAAARIVSSFSFQQEVNKEDLLRQKQSDRGLSGGLEMLMNSLRIAQANSGGNSGGRVTQLVFAISDGFITENNGRERIKKLVRDAAERQQLLVLLIVDNPDPKKSILENQRCNFVSGGKNKPKKMVFTSFLDDYPFPYYILLRSVETLPETLADALRQWFEMIHRTGE